MARSKRIKNLFQVFNIVIFLNSKKKLNKTYGSTSLENFIVRKKRIMPRIISRLDIIQKT